MASPRLADAMSASTSKGGARALAGLAVSLGVVTLAIAALLLVWNLAPARFPPGAHDLLGALPLAIVALAALAYQVSRPFGWRDLVKTGLLAAAFLFWAANQLWPQHPRALFFNDAAIVLFVLDVFLVIVGWPAVAGGPEGG
jgi:hypothetical protein